MAELQTNVLMEKLASLCKRRGFIFQSSEIYGGLNGFWDYGPLGADLKRNIKEYWWRSLTQARDDIVGLDAAIIMNRQVWEASGHTATFSDPMVDCRGCRKRFRVDQLPELKKESEWGKALEELHTRQAPAEDYRNWILQKGRRYGSHLRAVRDTDLQPAIFARLEKALEHKAPLDEIASIIGNSPDTPVSVLPCPHCGGELTEPRAFNLMFKTFVGPVEGEDNVAYLRPETAQAIFAQFKTVLEVSRQRIPFGICQIGKAFRNEINPRNFTFRSREFEQMELEFFIPPNEVAQARSGPPTGEVDYTLPQPNWGWKEWHLHWVEQRLRWYESIGLERNTLSLGWQKPEELAHYAKATVDILYQFPFGLQELEGIAARGDFDLAQHQKFSGKSMEYFDEEAKVRYVPHVIEPSAGVDRLVLALLCNAYREEEAPDENGKLERRVVLRLHPRIAPIKVGVFPLLKNRPELVQKAKAVRDLLRPYMKVFYDEAGAIGRRYRRQDEAGTPFGVTVDFDTLGETPQLKDTVTLRDRDSMKQVRVPIDELVPRLREQVGNVIQE